MLQITDLHTRYGDAHVLRGVSLHLPEGRALGLLGRNGMGKTTLIRSVLGYVRPAGGQVHWAHASGASSARRPATDSSVSSR